VGILGPLNVWGSVWLNPALSRCFILLSTHAEGQGVDISVIVCVFVFCMVMAEDKASSGIKLAASNFARQFISVQGRESPIFGNFAPPEAQNWTNRRACGPCPPTRKHYRRDTLM